MDSKSTQLHVELGFLPKIHGFLSSLIRYPIAHYNFISNSTECKGFVSNKLFLVLGVRRTRYILDGDIKIQ